MREQLDARSEAAVSELVVRHRAGHAPPYLSRRNCVDILRILGQVSTPNKHQMHASVSRDTHTSRWGGYYVWGCRGHTFAPLLTTKPCVDLTRTFHYCRLWHAEVSSITFITWPPEATAAAICTQPQRRIEQLHSRVVAPSTVSKNWGALPTAACGKRGSTTTTTAGPLRSCMCTWERLLGLPLASSLRLAVAVTQIRSVILVPIGSGTPGGIARNIATSNGSIYGHCKFRT